MSYAIGVAEPTSVYINTHGTGKISSELIEDRIRKAFDLTPIGIAKALQLKQPVYQQTAAYGHFGKENLPWEKIDNAILKALKF